MKRAISVLFILVSVVYNSAGQDVRRTLPVFPGDFPEWLADNLEYPESALLDKLTGTATVEFRIEKNGRLTAVKVVSAPHPDIGKDIVRVLYKSPLWTPATFGGTPVVWDYSIDIDYADFLTPEALEGMTVVGSYKKPVFVYGERSTAEGLGEWFFEGIESKDIIAGQDDLTGRIRAVFRIDADGNLTDTHILDEADPYIAEEIHTRLGQCPQWYSPAAVNGEVHTYHQIFEFGYVFPKDGRRAFLAKDRMPQFRGGGLMEFRSWVMSRIDYPADAQKAGIQGRVVAEFVVDKSGLVVDIVILESSHPSMSEEVERVLKRSPKWTPAYRCGKPVNMKYILPIDFRFGE